MSVEDMLPEDIKFMLDSMINAKELNTRFRLECELYDLVLTMSKDIQIPQVCTVAERLGLQLYEQGFASNDWPVEQFFIYRGYKFFQLMTSEEANLTNNVLVIRQLKEEEE